MKAISFGKNSIFPPRKRSLCEGYDFTPVMSVILVHGGSAPVACWDTHPQGRHPPGVQTPPRADTPSPKEADPAGNQTPLPRVRAPPCSAVHAGRYGHQEWAASRVHYFGNLNRFYLFCLVATEYS